MGGQTQTTVCHRHVPPSHAPLGEGFVDRRRFFGDGGLSAGGTDRKPSADPAQNGVRRAVPDRQILFPGAELDTAHGPASVHRNKFHNNMIVSMVLHDDACGTLEYNTFQNSVAPA